MHALAHPGARRAVEHGPQVRAAFAVEDQRQVRPGEFGERLHRGRQAPVGGDPAGVHEQRNLGLQPADRTHRGPVPVSARDPRGLGHRRVADGEGRTGQPVALLQQAGQAARGGGHRVGPADELLLHGRAGAGPRPVRPQDPGHVLVRVVEPRGPQAAGPQAGRAARAHGDGGDTSRVDDVGPDLLDDGAERQVPVQQRGPVRTPVTDGSGHRRRPACALHAVEPHPALVCLSAQPYPAFERLCPHPRRGVGGVARGSAEPADQRGALAHPGGVCGAGASQRAVVGQAPVSEPGARSARGAARPGALLHVGGDRHPDDGDPAAGVGLTPGGGRAADEGDVPSGARRGCRGLLRAGIPADSA